MSETHRKNRLLARLRSGQPGRRRWWLRWWFLGLMAAAAFAGHQLWTWPDVASLATKNPESTAFISDFLRTHPSEELRWTWVPYDAISPQLKQAVLVGEDIGFFSHEGFETAEIRAALRDRLGKGKPLRGASTLTQQLAKNLWLSPSRNPYRKVKEAVLTAQLERHLEKRRLLEIYLNVVEFGPGIYGAEAASRTYFGTVAAGLTTQQAAQLAASLPRPRSWNPRSESRGYRQHVDRIRGRMARATWIFKEL